MTTETLHYEIEDKARQRTELLIVRFNESQKPDAIRYIVRKTVEEEVHINDVIDHINQFEDIHAYTFESQTVENLELTTGEAEE